MADDRLSLSICEVFSREAEAVLAGEAFTEIVVHAFPPACLGMPGRAERLAGVIESSRRRFGQVCKLAIRCGCVGKNGADGSPSPVLGDIQQCLELVADRALLGYLQVQCGFFTVTRGWVKLWQDFLKKWGFDRETARDFFHESSSGVVLLDTGIDPEAERQAAEFAAFVDLPLKKVAVGLDHLRLLLTACIIDWRAARARAREAEEKNEFNRRLSDYALMAEVIREIAAVTEEAQVLEKGLGFVSAVLAPGRMAYVPVVRGALSAPVSSVSASPEETAAWGAFLPSAEDYALHASGQGFLIRVKHGRETVGIIDVDRVAFPRNLKEYLNMTLSYADALALAVVNARYYEELLRDRELLRIQASTDALTGVANRAAISGRLAAELARAGRENRPVCAAMVDVDHFKQVNDQYGHAAGDAVLKTVSGVIGRSLRAYDTLGRLGGEEFLIIVPGADETSARSMCERIRCAVEAHRTSFEDESIKVTISVGFAVSRGEADVERLIHLADAAMYRAKKAGRNRVESAGTTSG